MPVLLNPLDVRISGRIEQTPDIMSLDLVPLTGAPLPRFEAGAHIDVEVKPGWIRQYSLCSDPEKIDQYRIAILRDPKSRGGSEHAYASFKCEEKLRIGRPRNAFSLKVGPERSLMFAGGIGITPFIPMALTLSRADQPFTLHYSTRSRSRTAFLDELSRVKYTDCVKIHHDDDDSRFNLSTIPEYGGRDQIYICGPAGFVEYIRMDAGKKGWPDHAVAVERFEQDVSKEGSAFTVVAAKSGISVLVSEGETIAEKLLASGVDVPLSCEEGVCGACLTAILEGRPDHRDVFQTEAEKRAGTHMTLCCSRSRTPTIVLDI